MEVARWASSRRSAWQNSIHHTGRKLGLETAETWYGQVRQSGMLIIAPDEAITRSAAIWKIRASHLSLADCFALATLEAKAQVLLTTDETLSKLKGVRSVYFEAGKT